MSDLSRTAAELQEAWFRLCQRWGETKNVWNDPVRWDFEKEYWDVLAQQPPAVQQEMEQLAQVIAGAKRNVK